MTDPLHDNPNYMNYSKWFKNHLPNITVAIGILKRNIYLFELFPMVHKDLTLCPQSFPSVTVSKWRWELWPLLPAQEKTPQRAEHVQNPNKFSHEIRQHLTRSHQQVIETGPHKIDKYEIYCHILFLGRKALFRLPCKLLKLLFSLGHIWDLITGIFACSPCAVSVFWEEKKTKSKETKITIPKKSPKIPYKIQYKTKQNNPLHRKGSNSFKKELAPFSILNVLYA